MDKPEKSDVLVVGAGPVGLYLARLLEGSGLSATVLEEHMEIGRPNHCSGLISSNLDLFVRPQEEWVEYRVSGAVIRAGPSSIRLKKPGTAAYVIDRSRFDAYLAHGLDVRLEEKVEGVTADRSRLYRLPANVRLQARNRVEGVAQGEEGDDWREGDQSRLQARRGKVRVSTGEEGVLVKTNKGVYKAQVLIGCDGANSVVARHFGSMPKKLLQGVIAVTREENYSDYVEILVEKSLARDGFFWKIPRGKTTEYGMFAGRADFRSLEKFFSIKRPYERRAGLIPMGPGKTYFPRTLLVGDAAGMAKPWSGGGVIWGFTAARIAAKVVVQAFQERDFSESFLARYERGWKKAFGRQIQVGMLGRRLFGNLDQGDSEAVLKCLGFLQPLINRMDMDFLV